MLKLNSGFEMPAMGFGTAKIEEVEPFVNAIKNGYRHIDTASFYKNEQFIGEAIQVATSQDLVKREELFITTKIWHTEYDSPEDALR